VRKEVLVRLERLCEWVRRERSEDAGVGPVDAPPLLTCGNQMEEAQ
jgi:hypothetical protein